MATAKAEGLEGPQEAGGEAGETDPARRCDTAQVRKAKMRKKNISLRLEQTKFTGVKGFEASQLFWLNLAH